MCLENPIGEPLEAYFEMQKIWLPIIGIFATIT
jgi:hypothetical protein